MKDVSENGNLDVGGFDLLQYWSGIEAMLGVFGVCHFNRDSVTGYFTWVVKKEVYLKVTRNFETKHWH